MNTVCPFCKQSYEIEADNLDQYLECSVCKHTFTCSIVTSPVIGLMYVDVETTAAPTKSYAVISTIVWWCDNEWHSWINGKDSPEEFILFWKHSSQVVTFNGRAFDEPKIISQFGVHPHSNHLDLMHVAKEHGLTGGLKKVGEACNFPRPPELDSVDGAIAVKLWKRFQYEGADEALQNLLYYNAWDVVLTYCLHCHCSAVQARPIHETIPFIFSPDYLASVMPKPKTPGNSHREIGNIQTYWDERKKNPVLVIRGAEVCITGNLVRMEREEAEALIENLGGIAKRSATRTLDYLVVGDTGEFGKTSKIESAEQNIVKGAHTRIIDEDEFWEIVEKTQNDNETTQQ